ncbi:unnamed protein product [Lactuca saligna]|uniref:Uncharacterized protein n=1 Tax=Lactuca saligna TaxID=75948 RepID=A0AA35UW81_LACSI|nr:unnamed protein product [Lactuca saligna]
MWINRDMMEGIEDGEINMKGYEAYGIATEDGAVLTLGRSKSSQPNNGPYDPPSPGKFCSPMDNNSHTNSVAHMMHTNTKHTKSQSKKRKLIHLIPNSNLNTSVFRNLDLEFQPSNHLTLVSDKSFDLNVALSVGSNNGDHVDICSSSNEISSISKIRNEVGFHIGEDNTGILEDVLEVDANGEGGIHVSK